MRDIRGSNVGQGTDGGKVSMKRCPDITVSRCRSVVTGAWVTLCCSMVLMPGCRHGDTGAQEGEIGGGIRT